MKKGSAKTVCTNPNTGNQLQIDSAVYTLFEKAIRAALKGNKALLFSQIVEGVYVYLQKKQCVFGKSVEWYSIVVKQDLEVRGIIEAFTEKGRKLHRLGKQR
jgi:hypothetical protein